MKNTLQYALRLGPGWHGGPDKLGGLISRHRTIEAAVKAKEKEDNIRIPGSDKNHRPPRAYLCEWHDEWETYVEID